MLSYAHMKNQPPPSFPSEFEPPDVHRLPLRVLESRGFNMGRMISASKSGYPPHNFAIFNANIITLSEGKIWYGDLDLTEDGEKLKDIAAETGETLFVLREPDARFGKENDTPKVLAARAVWDITQDIPKYDKNYKVVFTPKKKG